MKTKAAVQDRTRLTLTVEEAAATLGISRAFAYEAVRRGEIPSIRIGRRVLVPRAALERLLDDDMLRQQMGENGTRLVRDKFTWDKVARDLVSLYRSIVADGRYGQHAVDIPAEAQ